jgi:phage terminase large subunit GpA-like protein
MSKDRTIEAVKQDGAHHAWLVHCPACDDIHVFDDRWTFNGNKEAPTFRASMLVHRSQSRCHSFVTDGRIEFLSDCTHALAGKTLDLPVFREKHPHWSNT